MFGVNLDKSFLCFFRFASRVETNLYFACFNFFTYFVIISCLCSKLGKKLSQTTITTSFEGMNNTIFSSIYYCITVFFHFFFSSLIFLVFIWLWNSTICFIIFCRISLSLNSSHDIIDILFFKVFIYSETKKKQQVILSEMFKK